MDRTIYRIAASARDRAGRWLAPICGGSSSALTVGARPGGIAVSAEIGPRRFAATVIVLLASLSSAAFADPPSRSFDAACQAIQDPERRAACRWYCGKRCPQILARVIASGLESQCLRAFRRYGPFPCDDVCENGVIDRPREQCDPPGSAAGCSAGELCGADCHCVAVSPTPTLTSTSTGTPTRTSTPTATPNPCGNHRLDAGEQCDPPGSKRGCGEGQFCSAECRCVAPDCGNGAVEPGEDCDPPGDECAFALSPGICGADCRCRLIRCGDLIVDAPPEDCDPPLLGLCPEGRICDRRCICVPQVCGNGTLEFGEECDPPGTGRCPDGRRCDEQCLCVRVPPTPTGTATATHTAAAATATATPTATAPATHTGTPTATGTHSATLTGTATATTTPTASSTASASHTPTRTPACGNGQLDPGEDCEPAGSTCTNCDEMGCFGSMCSTTCTCERLCGNNQVEPFEHCDPPGTTCSRCDAEGCFFSTCTAFCLCLR